ncbi:MAG TPA: hypothetical protein VIL05_07805 [Thermoclostridium sp.]
MRKTLKDVASYLKEIMVPGTYEAYEVNPVFTIALPAENIRKGVLAFRVFLTRLYECLYANGDVYDNSKKVPHEYENRITLSVYYPFLYNVSIMLMRIGYLGRLDENGQSMVCENSIFNGKLSVPKNLECLRFLAGCGICIDGMDINDKKQNLSDIKSIKITYPDDPIMLTGMKVMATAEIDHGTLVSQDVFLRCDYRVLKNVETDVLSIVQDTIRPLSPEVQDFVLELHRRYLNKGLTCLVQVKGFHVYIKYCYKRKDLWGINASLNNGYHINVKPTKTDEYADTIKTFAPALQELISKGYGCGRKREIGHCDGGCRGLHIPLDDSVLDIKDDIKNWFDQELLCLQKKH